jgi:acetyltransferase-like isoleucine patch superfamily enzyme
MPDNSIDKPNFCEMGAFKEELLYKALRRLFLTLVKDKAKRHNRYISLSDYIVDRWERAAYMGFGEGSSVYDSCLVLGDVKVGKDTWIGPYTILDGSGGGLVIGDGCAISAGVHIYTHDTVDTVISGAEISRAPVKIGNHVYIGPQTVISKGISIGEYTVIGAHSLVNADIPAGVKAFGNPAKIVGPSKETKTK